MFVDGVVNCPGAPNIGERKGCTIRVLEIADEQHGAGLIPASYEVTNGVIDTCGTLSFPQKHWFQVFLKYSDDWSLRFIVRIPGQYFSKGCVCQAEIGVKDLKRQPEWCLLLENPLDLNHSPCYRADSIMDVYAARRRRSKFQKRGELEPTVRRPAFLSVRTQLVSNIPQGVKQRGSTVRPTMEQPSFDTSPGSSDPHGLSPATVGSGFQRAKSHKTRVMMLAKGTRGDVQPFVALARGLVQLGCEVIMVTELCWKGFVKSARVGLPPGSLQFRPIGGNTMMVLRQRLSQWITWAGQSSDMLQTIIFSLSEANFFAVEGTCYHWAYEDNPDFIIFPHTLVHIAMILSEALKIPIVGFVLQPMHRVEERGEFHTVFDAIAHPIRKVFTSESFLAAAAQVMELTGGSSGNQLNRLRRSRGLHAFPSWRFETTMVQYKELQNQGVSIFVPINPLICQEQVQETPEFSFTDFIFLRLGTDVLDPEITSFIDRAHDEGRKVVTVAFSSMPIGEQAIVGMALEIVANCSTPVALLVMLAGQDFDPATPEQLQVMDELIDDGLMLPVYNGVPFGALFPLIDGLMSQGGLGVTSEALLAGVPVITSGVLLLDQRWWAARLHRLGCGSAGVPITNLMDFTLSGKRRAVMLVDTMFGVPKGSQVSSNEGKRSPVGPSSSQLASTSPGGLQAEGSWATRAKFVSIALRERPPDLQGNFVPPPGDVAPPNGDRDGVLVNAQAVLAAGTENKRVIKHAYREQLGCCGRAMRNCVWMCRMSLLFLMVIFVGLWVILYLVTEPLVLCLQYMGHGLRRFVSSCRSQCCQRKKKRACSEDSALITPSSVGKVDGVSASALRATERVIQDRKSVRTEKSLAAVWERRAPGTTATWRNTAVMRRSLMSTEKARE